MPAAGLWGEILGRIAWHRLATVIEAGKSGIVGASVTYHDGRRTVVLPDDWWPIITTEWPDFDSTPVADMLKAIRDADGLGVLPTDLVARLPTRSWRDLGIDLDEPVGKTPKTGVDWLAAQPEMVQRQIMGPARFDAWKAGSFPPEQWAVTKANPGWRSSVCPEPPANPEHQPGRPHNPADPVEAAASAPPMRWPEARHHGTRGSEGRSRTSLAQCASPKVSPSKTTRSPPPTGWRARPGCDLPRGRQCHRPERPGR